MKSEVDQRIIDVVLPRNPPQNDDVSPIGRRIDNRVGEIDFIDRRNVPATGIADRNDVIIGILRDREAQRPRQSVTSVNVV